MTSRGAKYWNTGSVPLIAPDLLGDIIASASDIALVISAEAKVLSVLTNPEHKLHGALGHWEGTNLRDHLLEDSIGKLEARMAEFAAGHSPETAVELNHADRDAWEFPIRYTFHRIGADGALLMLGRDLGPIAEMQQQLVRTQLALERDYEARREYDTRFRVLMEASAEAVVFVALATGRITDANRAAARLFGIGRSDLTGATFAQEFDNRRRGEFVEALTAAAEAEPERPLAAVTRRVGQEVLIWPTLFRAAGDRLLLCRVVAESPTEAGQNDLSERLDSFYRSSVEAIVFCNDAGVVTSANEAFLNFADMGSLGAVKGRSLADFLARGGVDLKVMLDHARRAGHMRLYATRLATGYGSQMPVEISATRIEDEQHPAFVFVMRDATRIETVRDREPPSTDTMRPVADLVGSTSLKEIVAETTDAVEKMCIETAVELTRNNRVAAAEMLGLSRQSLYVKLRKHGLLARGAEG